MAGIHAAMLLRHPGSDLSPQGAGHRPAGGLRDRAAAAAVGRLLRQAPGRHQPLKLAGAGGHFAVRSRAPRCASAAGPTRRRGHALRAGDPRRAVVPGLRRSSTREVRGLEEFPRDEWPPVAAHPPGLPGDGRRGQRHGGAGAAWPWCCSCAGGGCPPGAASCARWWRWPRWGWWRWRRAGWSPSGGASPGWCAGCMRTADAVTPFPPLAAPFWPSRWSTCSWGRWSVTCCGGRCGRRVGTAQPRRRCRADPAQLLVGGAIGGGAGPLLPLRRRRLRRRGLGSAGRGPRQRAAARADRTGDRPHLGGEPRLADPGRGAAFTAFPRAFAALSIAFHVPLTLFLIGIVFRGASFAFRSFDATLAGDGHGHGHEGHDPGHDRHGAPLGAGFSIASVVSPVLLGTVVGGVASGARGAGPGGAGRWPTPSRLAAPLPAGHRGLRAGPVCLPGGDLPMPRGRPCRRWPTTFAGGRCWRARWSPSWRC